MPTEQPSSAPTALPAEPREDSSAAAVLHDEQLDDTPGGGGLGGAAAASGGTTRATGGASPNSPIDLGLAGTDDAKASREATRDAALNTAEPHPTYS